MNFLSREATVAKPGFNRWLVPPAAIAVHMCIGEVYGFSVFNVPLTQAGAGWTIPQVGWVYSIALFMLGLSAAVFGKWVERSGPRKAMVASCVCFCGGLLISAIGVKLKMLWLVYMGYGFTGGIGLGLGYISPVSTLIKWFPDRPGMATGMAIMGFGGGALIGAPLGVKLMDYFKSATSIGVAEAFIAMAFLYAISMLFGAFIVRVPADGWKPTDWEPSQHLKPMMTNATVAVDVAWKTPQFWYLWVVLCMNVTAGIGILGQASKICSDMFGVSAAVGGGFATIPAYLRDMFGAYQVGAIHGRLITAWSVAALLGPSLVNYISTAKIEAGVPKAEAYNSTMFLMAGLLMVGLIANLRVRPVDPKYHRIGSSKA